MFLVNLAEALVWSDLRRATAILEAVDRAGWLEEAKSPARLVLWAELASCHALLGHADDAGRWLAKAGTVVFDEGRTRLLLAWAIGGCRTAREAEVASELARRWREGEKAFGAGSPTLRFLGLLRAFALERSAGSADEVRALLETARPLPDAHMRTIADHWPELSEFVWRHET